jgi:hypothetical protein
VRTSAQQARGDDKEKVTVTVEAAVLSPFKPLGGGVPERKNPPPRPAHEAGRGGGKERRGKKIIQEFE